MKKAVKVVMFFVASLVVSYSASAQYGGFGIRGGLNAANYQRNIFDNGTHYGFHGGIYTVLGFTEAFAIQPELLYSQKGRGNIGTINGVSANYSTRREYLDIPVFLRFNITPGFHFLAGPQASYLLSGQERFEGQTLEADMSDRWDWAGVVGLGYEFMNGFNVGVRYGYGLTTVGHSANMVNWRPRNVVGQFTLGYTFGGRSGRTGC
ncbi:MAG: porin family protein [Cytophagaceae bacterium]